MEIQMTKKESLEQLDKLEAPERQRLEARQRQLDQDWQRFNEEHDKRLSFIDALWSGNTDGKPQPQLSETQNAPTNGREHSPDSNGTGRRSVSDDVLVIVGEWVDGSVITQSEVTQRFMEKYPDRKVSSLVSLVSHALSQLAKGEDRVLDLEEKGAGSRPSKYRKRSGIVNMDP